jgi:hypothetical protein
MISTVAMFRKFLQTLANPVVMVVCGIGTVGYVATHPAREATDHERYLRELDPDRSVQEERVRTRSHRSACPICLDSSLIIGRMHPGEEGRRIQVRLGSPLGAFLRPLPPVPVVPDSTAPVIL